MPLKNKEGASEVSISDVQEKETKALEAAGVATVCKHNVIRLEGAIKSFEKPIKQAEKAAKQAKKAKQQDLEKANRDAAALLKSKKKQSIEALKVAKKERRRARKNKKITRRMLVRTLHGNIKMINENTGNTPPPSSLEGGPDKEK